MAKVLLINFPFKAKGMPTIFPIQFAALGGYLQQHGHNVSAVDLNVAPRSRLDELLLANQYDTVALSFRNVLPAFWLERFSALRKFIIYLKEKGVQPIVGGPGFSLFHSLIFKLVPEIQVGALGEGEYTLLRFVEGDDWQSIPGLCYRTEGGFQSNYPPRFLPGEEIPAYQNIDGLDYTHPEYLVGLQSYRGCLYDCAYCPSSFLRGDSIRLRPLENVDKDLQFLRAKGVEHFLLIDGVQNVPLERSKELLGLFNPLKHSISWEGFLKPLPKIDDEHVRKLAQSGAVRFHIDIISGTQTVGPIINHGVTIEESIRVAKLLKSHDIEGIFYFAYQLPTERLRDEVETFKHLRILKKMGHKTFIYPFFPYPSTGFEKYYGSILDKGPFWHIRRMITMMLRPSFFMFLHDLMTMTDITGPRLIDKR